MTWGVPLSVSYHFAFSYCSWGSQGKNTEVVCHSLLQWTAICQTSPPWPACHGLPCRHGLFIELDKTVVLVWCVCPLMSSCNTYHLTWVSLTLDVRYLFMAVPAKHNCCPLLCMRGITSHCPSWLSTWDGSTILFQTRCCYVGSEDRLDHCTPNTEISESNLFIFSNYFNGKTLNLHIGLVFALHQQE